jgi:hypothetical protein
MDAWIFREPRHQVDQGRRAKLFSTAVTSFREPTPPFDAPASSLFHE